MKKYRSSDLLRQRFWRKAFTSTFISLAAATLSGIYMGSFFVGATVYFLMLSLLVVLIALDTMSLMNQMPDEDDDEDDDR